MEIVLMNGNAIIPTRASKRSAGLDLYSSVDARIKFTFYNILFDLIIPTNPFKYYLV